MMAMIFLPCKRESQNTYKTVNHTLLLLIGMFWCFGLTATNKVTKIFTIHVVPIMVMILEILLTYLNALMTHQMWKLHLSMAISMWYGKKAFSEIKKSS